MRNYDQHYPFSPNYNFATQNLLIANPPEQSGFVPPITGLMFYEDIETMLFEDGTTMNYE